MDSPTVTVTSFISRISKREVIASLGPVSRYHLKNAALLTAVPLASGVTLLFLLVIQRWECWAVIAGTHAVIDRMAIASTICRLKNLIWIGPDAPEKEENTGYGIETPPFIRFWLVVIVDNTMHLVINHVALKYLNQ